MRLTTIVALLIGLGGCAVATPDPSGGGPITNGGKADEACVFGSDLDDITERFDVGRARNLTAQTRISAEVQGEMLAGMPPSIRTPEAAFAWVDDGRITRRALSRESEELYALFTYAVEGEAGGFVVSKGTTDVAAYLVGETIEDCRVVGGGTPDASACLFGATVDDLMQRMYDGAFTYVDEQILTVDSELSEEQARQLAARVPVGGGGVDVLFAQADRGEIEVGTLTSENTDHDAFTFYSYEIDGAPTGFVYTMESLELVATLENGAWAACTVSDAPSEDSACLFGGSVDALMEAMRSGDFGYVDEETLTAESELTDEQSRQLVAMVPVGGRLTWLFEQADRGEIEVGTLVDQAGDASEYTFYSYDREGAQEGFIYVQGSTERVAMLEDGAWAECNVTR